MADSTQFHQIIMNLATNAFHAMEKSGGLLKVSIKQCSIEQDQLIFPDIIPGDYAMLKVSDTGIGIPKEMLHKVFDPYFTTKEKNKGTGLGLSIVQGIVKSYGGAVRIYSEPGKGTEVHVYLPIVQTESEIHKSPDNESVPGGKEKILVVDDEDAIVQMEKNMLERLGYQVTPCTDSRMALETFKADPTGFDLIITDLTMPSLTGTMLATELRNIRPDIPILICTGFSDQISQHNCDTLGIQGVIMKPIMKREITGMIRKILDHGA